MRFVKKGQAPKKGILPKHIIIPTLTLITIESPFCCMRLC